MLSFGGLYIIPSKIWKSFNNSLHIEIILKSFRYSLMIKNYSELFLQQYELCMFMLYLLNVMNWKHLIYTVLNKLQMSMWIVISMWVIMSDLWHSSNMKCQAICARNLHTIWIWSNIWINMEFKIIHNIMISVKHDGMGPVQSWIMQLRCGWGILLGANVSLLPWN